jgi:hypothetical protein
MHDARMITSCSRGRVADCRIIGVLQDHALCEHHHGQGCRRRTEVPEGWLHPHLSHGCLAGLQSKTLIDIIDFGKPPR